MTITDLNRIRAMLLRFGAPTRYWTSNERELLAKLEREIELRMKPTQGK